MKKNLLWVVIFLLLNNTVIANDSCNELYSSYRKSFKRRYSIDNMYGVELQISSTTSKGSAQRVLNVFNDINDNMLKYLPEPQFDKIIINNKRKRNYIDQTFSTITINYQTRRAGQTLPPYICKGTHAHEYGHLIFNKMMHNQQNEISKAYVEIERVFKDNIQRLSDEEIKALSAGDADGFFKWHDERMKESLNHSKTERLIYAQHEFFADVVAVLYQGDIDGMYNALNYPDVKLEQSFRSFDKQKIDKVVADGEWRNQDSPHPVYTPTRGYLGDKYLVSFFKESNPDKSLMLKKIALSQLVAIEYQIRLNEGNEGNVDRISLDEQNKILQDAIDCVFSLEYNGKNDKAILAKCRK